MWTDTPTIFQVVIKLPHVVINLESRDETSYLQSIVAKR